MTRSLGIDIGSYSIKIAEVDYTGKEQSILGLFELALTPDDNPTEKLNRFFSSGSVKADRVAVGLGSRPILVKKLYYPTSDRKKAQQAIYAEFEDSVPFDLENYLIEFQKLGRIQKSHVYLAGLSHKESIDLINAAIIGAPQVPTSLCLDNEMLARMALLQHRAVNPSEPKVFCVCDIGFQSSKLAIVKELAPGNNSPKDLSQNIIEMRTLGKGALEIFDWMETNKNMSAADCEQWLVHRAKIKNEEGNLISDETSDDVKTALKPILVEIYQTLQALKSKQEIVPEYILLTGGLTQLNGFADFFAKEIRIETKVWDFFIDFDTQSTVANQGKKHRFALALSLADRARPTKLPPSLNFRRSSLASRRMLTSQFEKMLSPVNRPLVLGLTATFIAFFCYQMISTFFINSERDNLKTELVAQFRQLDPVLGKRAAESIEDINRLEEMFEKEKTRQLKNLDPSRPSRSDLVLYISQALPTSVKAQMLELNDGPSGSTDLNLTLNIPQGWSSEQKTSFQDQLHKELEQRGFKNVSKTPNGNNINFKARWQETM